MKLALSPIDTWFFRDSTPFQKGVSSQGAVPGVFPPYPSTVAGNIRATLALCNGWDGHGRWSTQLATVLGDGPDDLGSFCLTGPFVLSNGVPIFRAPRHVLGRTAEDGRWTPAGWLGPGDMPVSSDLGSGIRLPDRIADGSGSEPVVGARQWVTLAGLGQIAGGDLPQEDEIVADDRVWVDEFRTGLERDAASRSAVEGMLYNTRHTRVHRCVSIGVEVDGVPDDWRSPAGSVLPFGGESRLAGYDAWETEVRLPISAVDGASRSVVLIALTPVLLGHDVVSGRSELLLGGGTRIVCACVDRPLRIGGWDSLRGVPLPLRNAVPAGSALFCEVNDPEGLAGEAAQGLLRIGGGIPAGFGLCAVGRTPAERERI